MKHGWFSILALVCFCVTVAGCSSPPFDSQALDQSKLIKEEAISLMDKATEPFPSHQSSVEALKTRVDTAYSHEQTRSCNDEKIQQWNVIRDAGGNSLYGFLARWEREDTLRSAFIAEARKLVGTGFDQMIELEEGRK